MDLWNELNFATRIVLRVALVYTSIWHEPVDAQRRNFDIKERTIVKNHIKEKMQVCRFAIVVADVIAAHCLSPPIAYSLLPIAYSLLPIAHCLLPIAYCLLPIAYCYCYCL